MARSPHIIVVDDEPEVRRLLAEYLSMQGFQVSEADGAKALRSIVAGGDKVDLVLLDLRMPGEDGLSLARWLREHAKIGVIMITGSGDTADRVAGLEVGADDYISKPFDLRETLARVRSVLRRLAAQPAKVEEVRFGRFVLNLSAHRLATNEGETIGLTSMEFDLLEAFATHPNRVLSREQLLDLAHGRDAEPFDRAVDIRVTRLRRKIAADPENPKIIQTVRGAGYMFVPEPAA